MTKALKVRPPLEQILEEISALQKEVPGIGGGYLQQLGGYLQEQADKFADAEKQQKFLSSYAQAVKVALKKALERGELSEYYGEATDTVGKCKVTVTTTLKVTNAIVREK